MCADSEWIFKLKCMEYRTRIQVVGTENVEEELYGKDIVNSTS